MYGFTIIYNNTKSFETDAKQKMAFTHPESGKTYSFFYEQGHKFKNDQLFQENEHYIIGIDGVILNLLQLKNEYGVSTYFDLIQQLYQQNNHSFYEPFRGNFSGFVFDKKTERCICFTDHNANGKLFYTQINNEVILSPLLDTITHFKATHHLTNSLNIDAAYMLLTYGGMYENNTLINEVFKLHAGEYMELTPTSFAVNTYHDYNQVEAVEANAKKVIPQLDELFNAAIQLEYEKDKEYNYDHIATLSGGLDSRMNVMTAHQLGYKTHNFCFSQSNYDDQKIAKRISDDLNETFSFISLDKAEYLTDLEENMNIYNGLIFYLASAHYNYALTQLDLKNTGLIHTGRIGDGILGGFVSNNYFSSIISPQLKDRLPEMDISKYRSEETFKLYNRVFNVTIAGTYVSEQYQSYLVSPFLNPEFIECCLSIHPSLKKDSKIYIDWINQLHPEIARYKWEKTGFKPNAMWKIKFSRFSKKIKSAYYKTSNQLHKTSMNPYDYWYDNTPAVRHFFNTHFDMYIGLVENPTLNKDITQLFNHGNTIEKSMVITLLEAIHKYQLKN